MREEGKILRVSMVALHLFSGGRDSRSAVMIVDDVVVLVSSTMMVFDVML